MKNSIMNIVRTAVATTAGRGAIVMGRIDGADTGRGS